MDAQPWANRVDGLVKGERLHDQVATDELLGFGERTVEHEPLRRRSTNARALRARLETFAADHRVGFDERCAVRVHSRDRFERRRFAGLEAGADHRDVPMRFGLAHWRRWRHLWIQIRRRAEVLRREGLANLERALAAGRILR